MEKNQIIQQLSKQCNTKIQQSEHFQQEGKTLSGYSHKTPAPPSWLNQAQVMVPGSLLVQEPFVSIPSAISQGSLSVESTTETPHSSLTIAPLVINGLLVGAIALMMIVRPQAQQMQQRNSQETHISEEINVQSGNFSEVIRIFVVFLTASAIYISPYLRKYVPPIVRLIGGLMIGVIFNLALKYIV